MDDDDLYKILSCCKSLTVNRQGYVFLSLSNGRKTPLARHILGIKNTRRVADHINGNPRDNRRANLRNITYLQNSWNQKIFKTNKSGVAGVHFQKHDQLWVGEIYCKGRKFKKYSKSKDVVVAWRKQKEIELHKGFTRK